MLCVVSAPETQISRLHQIVLLTAGASVGELQILAEDSRLKPGPAAAGIAEHVAIAGSNVDLQGAVFLPDATRRSECNAISRGRFKKEIKTGESSCCQTAQTAPGVLRSS